jgi:hypothetical protein
MRPARNKLRRKLRLALLGTALLTLLALAVASLPFLFETVRQDRIKVFVEQSTRALAEELSHQINNAVARLQRLASDLAIETITNRAEMRALDRAAAEPVNGLLGHGIFDLLVVVESDGTILYLNTHDRFGRLLNTTKLWGRHISEFPEEERAYLGAAKGLGRRDWYRSKMVAAVKPGGREEDVARQHHIAFAVPVPQSRRVLVGVVNWEFVQAVLDNVEPKLHAAGFGSAYAFMFARDANTIIAHKFRDPQRVNNYGTRLIEDHKLAELVAAVRRVSSRTPLCVLSMRLVELKQRHSEGGSPSRCRVSVSSIPSSRLRAARIRRSAA